MVKLLVIARVIPEDAYLRSVEQNVPITPVLEKKFRIPVRDPESWYVGRLAIEIKNCYERLYRRPLGEIKYLKDDEDDCDLDPEQSVSDLLIDEGKAAKDGSDQRVTVKIIQEQGRAIRAGSVIPDLSRVEYQPPVRPPVPKFSENKRPREDDYGEDEQVKRRRLGQIEEEESENLVHSIEQDGERAPSHFELQDARFLSALNSGAFGQMQPKIESPELPPWRNPHPATRDELEILPEAPKDLHFRARRTGLPVSGPRRSRELEIGESSEINFELNRQNPADLRGSNHGHPNPVLQQTSRPSAPFTPPDTGSTRQTSKVQAVSMLNGMKSASPADRQPSTHSATKFRKPGTNGTGIYDHPESDIDDSQMSPGSRNSRRKNAAKPVTPRLVSVPNRRQTPYSETSRHERDSTANTSDYTNNASRNPEHLQLSYVNSGSTAGQQALNNYLETGVESERSDTSREQSGFNLRNFLGYQAEESAMPPRPSSKRAAEDNEPSTGAKIAQTSGNTISQRTDADTMRKKARTQQDSALEGHRVRKSKSRSDSAVPSERISSKSDQLSRSHILETNEDEEPVGAGVNEGDTTEELDGPGEQLLQNLNQDSPERSQQRQVIMNIPPRKAKLQDKGKGKQVQSVEDAEREEIERLPQSDTDSDRAISRRDQKKAKATSNSSQKQQKKGDEAEEELRCLTCWRKKAKCNNMKPKCASCEKNQKNCQEYALTKEAADEIYAERRAAIPQKSKSKSKAKTNSSGKLIDKIKSKDLPGQEDQQRSKKAVSSINKDNVTIIANSQSDAEDVNQASRIQPASKGSTKTSRKSNHDQTHDQQEAQSVTTNKKVPSKKTISKPSENADDSSKAPRPESRGSSNTEMTEPASKPNQSLAVDQPRQERSTESQMSMKTQILPPGMTQEQYDLLIATRSQLTEEQRKADNLRFRKSESRKESTPATVPRSMTSDTRSRTSKDIGQQNESVKQVSRSSSSQVASERSNEELPNIRPTKQVPSSSQSNARDRGRKSLPATQPNNVSASLQVNTPGPAKSIPQPATEPPKPKAGIIQKRATPIPITAAEKASVVKNNPPFRPHKALANSSFTAVNHPVPAQHTSMPEASIGQVKSLSGLRNILDKKKSASSTPQPNSAMDKLVAETKRASARLNGFTFGDEDEEEETETESDDDDQQGKENHNIVSTKIGKSPLATMRKKPTEELETGSESSDDNSV